ncbi:MAG TPA: serine hydrolase domain-containing protein [Propionibacteriaceae bacterium]
MSAFPIGPDAGEHTRHPSGWIDELGLKATVAQVLDHWPCAGLAVAVIADGRLAWFHGHGLADVAAKTPITEDTVFRIASLTKPFTAVAVMQLWEEGLVDLDAPANDYLRTFRLVPAKPNLSPATVRHLLTHTAGVGYWRRLSDLLQPGVGSGDRARRSGAPPLADYYRRGLPVEVEPGTKWAYSNHGFAALGQIVEDVSGQPLDRYLRDRIFDPLGMEHTDLIRSERVKPYLATGYVLRSRGLEPVADREVPTAGGGGMYSTTADIARYVAALLRIAANEHGSVLRPETVATMFRPHFQPDPRVPGMGLAFELGEEGGQRTVGKTGILSGFHSAMALAPEEGIGVLVFSNTGGIDGRGATVPLATMLLRLLLGLSVDPIRIDIPPRAETWSDICGWYGPAPGPVTNLFSRALMGAGAEVVVQGGHLMLKPLTPIPAMRRGFRLYPDDPDDPWVFRIYSPEFGMNFRVVFDSGPIDGAATRLLLDMMSFDRRPDLRNPRPWLTGGLAVGTAALAIRSVLRRRHQVGPGT